MTEIQDYYLFLGVSRNATDDEIKRAWVRKLAEFRNDEDRTIQTHQAYEILCNTVNREQYDIRLQFGSRIDAINEKISKSTTYEQRKKYLLEKKKIYLDILNLYSSNIDTIKTLAEIEEFFGNNEKTLEYLKQLDRLTTDNKKIQIHQQIGKLYIKIGNIDEAIKYFYLIYQTDVTYEKAIKILVRFLYEYKNNYKEAILILSDCINKCSDSKLKIIYLCEILRAIRKSKKSAYKQVEDSMYKKLESFRSDDEQINLTNASIVASCISDFLKDEDYEFLHKLETVYQSYDVKNSECIQMFEILKQKVKFFEEGKIHKAINLYISEERTNEIRKEFGILLIKDAEKIKASLEGIKKEIPEFWNENKSVFLELDELVKKYMSSSKEYNSLINDRTISCFMKKMIECILLEEFIVLEDMKEEFVEARASFFDREDKEKVQYTLKKIEQFYPICYAKIVEFLYENKSSKNSSNSNDTEEYEHKPYVSGILEIIILIVVFCCLPPAIPIIFIVKYYLRHKKEMYKMLKVLKVVGIVAAILSTVFPLIYFMYRWIEFKREEAYLENHNGFLTDEELKKRDDMEDTYEILTDIDIHMTQVNEYDGVSYPTKKYIWLVITNHGYWWEINLKSNYLSDNEINSLSIELSDLYYSNNNDFYKCKKFYELAYNYIELKGDTETSAYVDDFLDSQHTQEILQDSDDKDKYERFYDQIIYNNPTINPSVAEKYATVLLDSANGILPYGIEYERLNLGYNMYAVHDVDLDGIMELIVSIQDTYISSEVEIVYEYDEETAKFTQQFTGYPACTYYNNGVIKEVWSHNHGLGPTIQPYNVHRYNIENNQYEYFFSIDSWDKYSYPCDYDGNLFPDQIDIDKNGLIYFVYLNENSYLYDDSECAMLVDSVLSEPPIVLNWINY